MAEVASACSWGRALRWAEGMALERMERRRGMLHQGDVLHHKSSFLACAQGRGQWLDLDGSWESKEMLLAVALLGRSAEEQILVVLLEHRANGRVVLARDLDAAWDHH